MNYKIFIYGGCGDIGQNVCNKLLSEVGKDTDTKLHVYVFSRDAEKAKTQCEQYNANISNNIKFIPTTNINDTALSDVIINTAGIAAGKHQQSDRNGSVYRTSYMAYQLATAIKQSSGSKKPLILVVSNPVDVVTHVMREVTDYSANRVLGLGSGVDLNRFKRSLAEQLSSCVDQAVNAEDIEAVVLGTHSASGMLFPVSSIKISGVDIKSFLKNKTTQSARDIVAVCTKQARDEGLGYVTSNHGRSSSTGAATELVNVILAYIGLKSKLNTFASVYQTADTQPVTTLQGAPLASSVTIQKGKVKIHPTNKHHRDSTNRQLHSTIDNLKQLRVPLEHGGVELERAAEEESILSETLSFGDKRRDEVLTQQHEPNSITFFKNLAQDNKKYKISSIYKFDKARAYYIKGDYEKAIHTLTKLLSHWSPRSKVALKIHLDLAMIYSSQYQFKEAICCYQNILAQSQHFFPSNILTDHEADKIKKDLQQLASTDSEIKHEPSRYKIDKKISSGSALDRRCRLFNNIGNLHMYFDMHTKALEYYELANKINEQFNNDDPLYKVITITNQSHALAALERFEEAFNMQSSAMLLATKHSLDSHAFAASLYNSSANNNCAADKNNGATLAVKSHQIAIKKLTKAYPDGHSDLAVLHFNLASDYIDLKKTSEAVVELEKAKQLAEQHFRKEHPIRIRIQNVLQQQTQQLSKTAESKAAEAAATAEKTPYKPS